MCRRYAVQFNLFLFLHLPGVLYFIMKYYTDKYNIYYVYRPASFNGQQFLHQTAVTFVISGVVILQLSTLFFSLIRLGEQHFLSCFWGLMLGVKPFHTFGTQCVQETIMRTVVVRECSTLTYLINLPTLAVLLYR